jgi:dihydrofolate synthase/folylpolyglutamate synthase
VIDRPLVCGIAAVGIDHQQYLGHSLGQIAAEKAGIARRGVPLVALAQPPEAEAAIIQIASEIGAPLRLEGRDWQPDPGFTPNLAGAHQQRNANLAWQMLGAQDQLAVTRAQFEQGIDGVQWPARFQNLADGPLNELGPMHIILGILANKDADAIVAPLRPHALSMTFVPVEDHEHHVPAALAERYGGRAAQSLETALAPLPAPRLVAGSLYLAGRALELNNELPD